MKIDKYSEEWSQLVYPVGAHIVVNDPYKREIEVHNARDIAETRSYAIDTMPPEPKGHNMPSLYDLGKGKDESA